MFEGDRIINFDKMKQASSRYPKPPGTVYTYGTAGFRMDSELLDCVMVRMGFLAVLRSKYLKGKAIGVMVTASHNPEQDNGVKIVDPMGEMLESSWEIYATELVNLTTINQISAYLSKLLHELNIDTSAPAKVVIARDTRKSGSRLVKALVDGASAFDAEIKNFQEMTTPELHYFVRCYNTMHLPAGERYGEPDEDGYMDKLAKAFADITSGFNPLPPLLIDAANGIGAPKAQKLIEHSLMKNCFKAKIVNDDIRGNGVLNFKCGADYVKVQQGLPRGITEDMAMGNRCASLDGDADRVVYYFVDSESKKFVLLDGDKIAALAAGFISDQLNLLPDPVKSKIELGVVQTAYANGASTKYFAQNGIPAACTPTGVKHLHHKAEEYGIGVYFEANGHGTIIFSDETTKLIKGLKESDLVDEKQKKAWRNLLSLFDLINQAVGDALSDMLLVEAILTIKQWSPNDWANLYDEFPSRQLKVKVADRTKFTTTDAERKLVSPSGIQAKIDEIVSNFDNGRSFVRPSGTEDVVRIYAEASSQKKCDELAYSIAQMIFDNAGGVGDRPTNPNA